jgi:uncharacterized protein (TIGR02284 family)
VRVWARGFACAQASRRGEVVAGLGPAAKWPTGRHDSCSDPLGKEVDMETQSIDTDIKHLNSLLRGERSAVETYQQCLDKLENTTPLTQQLSMLKSSHDSRVRKLSARIMQLGGQPDDSSGAWGTFAKAVEGSAKVFGQKAAISALEEGEDHGNKEYSDLDDLTPSTRRFVEVELLPEQRRTHDTLSGIKASM